MLYGSDRNDINELKFFTTTMMEFYLSKNSYLREFSYYSNTPLHWAMNHNNMEFIKILPLHLIDLSKDAYCLASPFYHACSRGKKEVVELFFSLADEQIEAQRERRKKGRAQARAEMGRSDDPETDEEEYFNEEDYFFNKVHWVKYGLNFTPFINVCAGDDVEIVEIFLANSDKGIQLHKTDNQRSTGLHWACKAYHHYNFTADILSLLLKNVEDKDFNVFARNNFGLTPFETACEYGATSAVSVFLNYFEEKGIKITDHGMKPLICVAKKVERWSDCSLDWDVYHDKMYEERKIIAEILIRYFKDSGIDLFVYDSEGRNPLHHACASGSIDVVKLLLESFQDIDINQQDDNGRTALHHASSQFEIESENEGPAGYPNVVEFLLSNKEELGLDPSIKDNEEMTALKSVREGGGDFCRRNRRNAKSTEEELIAMFEKYEVKE
eukprot:08842.XXX_274709_276137_1 [CDS] Oithona nana genome sequencing.